MSNEGRELNCEKGCVDMHELELREQQLKHIKRETLEYEREELIELLNAYYHSVRRSGQRCKSDGIRFAIEVIRDRHETGLIV